MKIKVALFLFFSVTSIVFAQDCVNMKDNEEQRLDIGGGPLSHSRIQDQDGLGTCYANSTSVALQTALPGNPDVSYLQLAFAHGEMKKTRQPHSDEPDSAYDFAKDGKQKRLSITKGSVCQTIIDVRDPKIGGACLRDDVPLENAMFGNIDPSHDGISFPQKEIMEAVSEYYDSSKSTFGISSTTSKEESAKRTLAFNKYKKAFDEMIKQKKTSFTKDQCLKPDISNVQTVIKNIISKNYTYLTNKYGSANSPQIYKTTKSNPNPDTALYIYFLNLGSAHRSSGDQLTVTLDKNLKKILETGYLAELKSPNPPSDAQTALRKTLLSLGGENKERNKIIADQIIKDLGPEETKLLNSDFNRYVKKDLSRKYLDDCMSKNGLNYYQSDQGLIKDFAATPCLKDHTGQSRNIQHIAEVLGKYKLVDVDTLNALIHKLPTMGYEEAMRAILAPECSKLKKIKIPQDLSCDSINFDYIGSLQQKLIESNKFTSSEIEQKIDAEVTSQLAQIESNLKSKIASIDKKYAGKIDSKSRSLQEDEKSQAEKDKISQKNIVQEVARAKIIKQLTGDKEPHLWSEYLASTTKKFNSDAVNLLKISKQAIPITLCTGMFSNPDSTALRDGKCGLNPNDKAYEQVGGVHSVAVIGVRCKKGRLNYLIQNSWGDWNSIKKVKNKNGSPHFQSELGKAWMDGDELMNNSYGYQKITK